MAKANRVRGAFDIDYSKWDHLDDYSNSSDDENQVKAKPRVTKLEHPGSVTLSSDGIIHIPCAEQNCEKKDSDAPKQNVLRNDTEKDMKRSKKIGVQSQKKVNVATWNELTHNGGSFMDPLSGCRAYWSQTRYQVILSVPFDAEIYRSKDLQVKLVSKFEDHDSNSKTSVIGPTPKKRHRPLLPYSSRHCSTDGGDPAFIDRGILIVAAGMDSEVYHKGSSTTTTILLKGELPHFVHGTQEQEEDDHDDKSNDCYSQIDWEIVNDGPSLDLIRKDESKTTKLVRIILRKAVPMQGCFIWWEQPLLHCPKIDLATITERGPVSQNEISWRSSWEEAHSKFKDKIKQQSQIKK